MSRSDLQGRVVAAMREAFPDADPSVAPFYAMMQYHLGWLDERFQPDSARGGKLLRPLLALLANRALGGRDEQALPLAAALQLLHDFSLVHDDIQDNSPTRRSRATVWRIWGLPQAINVGDGMFALAHRSLYRLADAGVPAGRVLRVARDFEETILRICEGQYLDIAAETRMDVSESQYLQMIRGKTAMLAAASTGLGAQVATDDESQIAAMWQFGEALGMAFQMQDDLLDIWGEPEVTGKPFAADLVQRKMSLPVIYGLAHATAADRERFESLYRQPALTHDDLLSLLQILDRAGARTHVERLARAEYDRAMDALDHVMPADAPALDELRGLAQSLLDRVH
jgi:geranylgeranyl diphosphate synthase, type I